MKKTISKLLAIAMAASMVLTGCGGSDAGESSNKDNEGSTGAGKEEGKEEAKADDNHQIKDLIMAKTSVNEITTFNMLYANNQNEQDVLCNAWDGLLETDNYGKLCPAIAEEWGTEDGGLNWTFKLRDGVKWVDVNAEEKGDCLAQDFATGLEWVLNFYKNDSNNTSMPIQMIKGAREYYEYTKSLSEEEAKALTAESGSKFLEMVGIEIPDEHTVVYHCIDAKPYFDSVASYSCMFPLSAAMVEELGVDGVRSMNNETMWYNGAYTITDYVQGNEKVFTKNPTYWDKDCYLFDTVTTKMVESNDVAFQLYQNDEIDEVSLTESNIATISGDEKNKYHNQMVEKRPTKYSWQVHFNFDKMKEDGTPDDNWNKAIANEAFRLAWYYGLDLVPSYRRVNAINPMSCENNAYTMKGLCYTSDGTDYTELVREELGLPKPDGVTPVRVNKEKFEQYKKQAMEELSAIGVTFPVMVDHYIQGSNQVALDSVNVLKQAISDSLGDDFVQLNILTYVQSARQEVYDAKKHSMIVNGWGADYGDPENYLVQEIMGEDSAFYSQVYSNIDDVPETDYTKDFLASYREFTQMVKDASAINDDMDARYHAFAKAEAYMIQHAFCFPHYYDVGWCLTKINPYSKMNAMYGCQNGKMKNIETHTEPYTTEESEQLKAEFNK